MEVQSEAKDISFSIVFHVMCEIVKMNPILQGKRITLDRYFQSEVLIWELGSKHRFNDTHPDVLCTTRVIYQFLREVPNMIAVFENSDLHHSDFSNQRKLTYNFD